MNLLDTNGTSAGFPPETATRGTPHKKAEAEFPDETRPLLLVPWRRSGTRPLRRSALSSTMNRSLLRSTQ
jgi:hypothetical protein